MRRQKTASGVGRRPDHHRARRIAKQHTSLAIAPIDETSQQLGADYEDPLGIAGPYELVSDAQRIKRARASGGNIEGKGACRTELGLNDDRAGRQRHVGRDRGDDDHVEIFGSCVGHRKRMPRRDNGHIRSDLPFRGDPALLNARALADPRIGRVDQLLKILVRQNPFRTVGASSEKVRV